MAAATGSRPAWSRSRIACISTRPFRVATPDTAMKPTAAETEKGIPLSSRASAPPTRAKGTQAKTSPASVTEPSAMNSSTPIRTKTMGMTSPSLCSARFRFSN
ncbi:hypothetical protein D3C72_2130470 [compost metagenome]